MKHRETVPVGRRASALSVAATAACLAFASQAHAQADATRPPPQPAGVPKAPAETPIPPDAPPSKTPPTAPAAPDAKPPVTAPKALPEPEAEPDEAKPMPGETPTSPAGVTPMPLWPEPAADAAALEHQGAERPRPKASTGTDERVYAEDWWAHARPVFELHGYFR